MGLVSFEFDIEKDLWNVWDSANFVSPWADVKGNMPKSIVELCLGKKISECREGLIKLNSRFYKSDVPVLFAKAASVGWSEIEDKFFEKLEDVFGQKLVKTNINCYVTTSPRCPYNFEGNDLWFMISIHDPIYKVLKTCGHEIFHIYFHRIYEKELSNKLSKSQFADLKESLTVLLNVEFKNLFIVRDKGYPVHQELRTFISEQWERSKNFSELIDKCVNRLTNDN
jgi:hypothetical protein